MNMKRNTRVNPRLYNEDFVSRTPVGRGDRETDRLREEIATIERSLSARATDNVRKTFSLPRPNLRHAQGLIVSNH